MHTVSQKQLQYVHLSMYFIGHSTSYDRMMRTVRTFRSQFGDEATRQQRLNFALYKDKDKNKSWTVKFVCLASKDAKRVPATAAERELLVAASLREKRVLIPNTNCSWSDFRALIVSAFPSLNDSGGFEFLRCISNTKDLEVIRLSVAQSPKLLSKMIVNGRVFIRPIQRDLVLHDQEELTVVAQVCNLEVFLFINECLTLSLSQPSYGGFVE